MEHYSEIFVGIDVAKTRIAIAVAEGERGGEVRFLGEVDASEENMRRVGLRTNTEPFTIVMRRGRLAMVSIA